MVVVGGNGSGDCEWSHGSHDYAPSGGIVILVGDGGGLAVALGVGGGGDGNCEEED